MSYRRREIGPPPGGELTPNEVVCLKLLQQEGAGIALTTTQIASRTSLGTSSTNVALSRLVSRGLVDRSDALGRKPNDPVRWWLLDAPAAA